MPKSRSFFSPGKLRHFDADPTGSADRAKCRDRRVLSGRGSVRTTVSPCRSDVVRSASTAVALYDRSTHLRGHTRPTRPPPPPGCVRSSSTASGSTTTVSIFTALAGQYRQHRAAQLPPTACPVFHRTSRLRAAGGLQCELARGERPGEAGGDPRARAGPRHPHQQGDASLGRAHPRPPALGQAYMRGAARANPDPDLHPNPNPDSTPNPDPDPSLNATIREAGTGFNNVDVGAAAARLGLG